ncbi:MAG: hypothetical protein QXR82_07525 [Candidatus Bathyarchaeia archaeon]
MKSLIFLGLILIFLGLTLVILTYLIDYLNKVSLKSLKKLPKFLIYVYEKDELTFITSPILIIIGLVYIVWFLFKLYK